MEGSVNVTTSVVFLALFGVLAEERFLVKGDCPRRDAGCVMCYREDDPEVAGLAPSAGTLDRRRVGGEETVSVSDQSMGRFSWMLGRIRDGKPSVMAPTD